MTRSIWMNNRSMSLVFPPDPAPPSARGGIRLHGMSEVACTRIRFLEITSVGVFGEEFGDGGGDGWVVVAEPDHVAGGGAGDQAGVGDGLGQGLGVRVGDRSVVAGGDHQGRLA